MYWLIFISLVLAVLKWSNSFEVSIAATTDQVWNFELHLSRQEDNTFLYYDHLVVTQSVGLCFIVDEDVCDCIELQVYTLREAQNTKTVLFSSLMAPSCLLAIQKKTMSAEVERQGSWFAVEMNLPHHHHHLISAPLYLDTESSHCVNPAILTLVLPLTLSDLKRSEVLLDTLSHLQPTHSDVLELLVFTPKHQVHEIEQKINEMDITLSFPLHVYSETSLYLTLDGQEDGPVAAYGYGVQMAIKLMAARRVRTPFYLTLDADIILLKPSLLQDILVVNEKQNAFTPITQCRRTLLPSLTVSNSYKHWRAVYEDEKRSVHVDWWKHSASFLNHLCSYPCTEDLIENVVDDRPGKGFGVTPAVLSTFGSLMTLRAVRSATYHHRMKSDSSLTNPEPVLMWTDDYIKKKQMEMMWLEQFGKENGYIWTEYTLYRITLDFSGLFHHLHIPELKAWHSNETIKGERNTGGQQIHCHDVWYASQLPWRAADALAAGTKCMFSVVQSSSNVDPDTLRQQLRAHR